MPRKDYWELDLRSDRWFLNKSEETRMRWLGLPGRVRDVEPAEQAWKADAEVRGSSDVEMCSAAAYLKREVLDGSYGLWIALDDVVAVYRFMARHDGPIDPTSRDEVTFYKMAHYLKKRFPLLVVSSFVATSLTEAAKGYVLSMLHARIDDELRTILLVPAVSKESLAEERQLLWSDGYDYFMYHGSWRPPGYREEG